MKIPSFEYQISNFNRNGQIMLVGVIMLGGAILSAGAIAGLLTIYQIRQTNDIIHSAKAFFAADAGIEWKSREYNYGEDLPVPIFEDNINISATITIQDDERIIRSQGYAATAVRALETIFIVPPPPSPPVP